MRCERCGEPVERYELDGAAAISCPACGYIGVPVDHKAEPQPHESWQDAFERFYDRFGVVADATESTSTAMVRHLTDLEGVGPAVATRLRQSGYDTVDALATATPEDLEAVDGIGPRLAARLVTQLSGEEPATVDADGGA